MAQRRKLTAGSADAGDGTGGTADVTKEFSTTAFADDSVTDAKIAAHTTTKITSPYSLLTLTGAILDGDLAGSIALSKLVTPPEANATADQTGAEIKTAYEAEVSAFTDAQFTKLGGIETLADVTDTVNVNSALATNVGTIDTGVWNGTAVTYANLSFTNDIVDGDLATGVFASITGLGTQSQNLNLGGLKIIDIGGTSSQTADAINLTNDQQIGFENAGGTANIGIKVNTDDDFEVNGQQFIITKLGSTQRFCMQRNEILSGSNVGAFRMTSFNSSSADINYAQIFFRVEDSTAGNEDGAIKFNLFHGGASNDVFTINNASDNQIKTLLDFNINGKNIINTGTLTLPTSTDTLMGKATTDVMTNKTYDADATGNVVSNMITETAEQSNTPVSDDSEATSNNTKVFIPFILPTTEKLYIITGIEWKNGATIDGFVSCGVSILDADPPTDNNTILVANGKIISQSGVSSIQRNSDITSQPIRGGTQLGVWFNTDSATATFRFLGSQPSINRIKSVTFVVGEPNGENVGWSSDVNPRYIKVYYRGYE